MTMYKYIPLCHISELEKYLFRTEIAGQNVYSDLMDHRIENYTFHSGIQLQNFATQCYVWSRDKWVLIAVTCANILYRALTCGSFDLYFQTDI